jgi:hypothetical protein
MTEKIDLGKVDFSNGILTTCLITVARARFLKHF